MLTWILKIKDGKRLEAQQTKFLRLLAGYTLWGNMCNQLIIDHLGMTNIVEDTEKYQVQWKICVERMENNRLPKKALLYKPQGKRNDRRPGKRWADQY